MANQAQFRPGQAVRSQSGRSVGQTVNPPPQAGWAERTVDVSAGDGRSERDLDVSSEQTPGVPSQDDERTAEVVHPTDRWAEQTVDVSGQPGAFRRGVAQVGPRDRGSSGRPAEEPEDTLTDTGWRGAAAPPAPHPAGSRRGQLRRGSGWTKLGGLFAFVCWGIWAISAQGNMVTPMLAFILALLVAAGLFALSRLLGRVMWENQFGRTRRSARGSHFVTGLFLAGVGIAYLRQTAWVMSAWDWLTTFW